MAYPQLGKRKFADILKTINQKAAASNINAAFWHLLERAAASVGQKPSDIIAAMPLVTDLYP